MDFVWVSPQEEIKVNKARIFKKRKLNEEDPDESSSEQNGEGVAKKAKNTVTDFSWVTAEDESGVGDAIAEKDYSQLYLKGERVQLLEKLFENRWLKYGEWKREREFEREFNCEQLLGLKQEFNNDREAKTLVKERKLKNDVQVESDAKKATTGAWYEMSSSEDEDEEPEPESELTKTKSANFDAFGVNAKADSTFETSCVSFDNTEYNLHDYDEKDNLADTYYNADDEEELDEEELDEEIGW